MTTQTRVLPDLDEALDWDPTCQATYINCGHPAVWLGVPPTCSHSLLCCDFHHRSTLTLPRQMCGLCRVPFPTSEITWRPL